MDTFLLRRRLDGLRAPSFARVRLTRLDVHHLNAAPLGVPAAQSCGSVVDSGLSVSSSRIRTHPRLGILPWCCPPNSFGCRRWSSQESFDRKRQIAIIGCGAVGSYYGARLWQNRVENEVHFLMRDPQYSVCQKKGLIVQSVLGNVSIPPEELQAYSSVQELVAANNGNAMDWVVVCLKSTSMETVPSLVRPLLCPSKTRVLCIMNGFVDEDIVHLLEQTSAPIARSNFPLPLTSCAAVYGGMALIASSRLAPGVVHHSNYGKLVAGLAGVAVEMPPSETLDTHRLAIEELWTSPSSLSGNVTLELEYESSLLRGRWLKSMWNLPMNGISVAMGGIPVDQIVADTEGLRALALRIVDETVAVANADLQESAATTNKEISMKLLGDEEKRFVVHLAETIGSYLPSTSVDFLNRRPMEVYYLFRKAVERAQELNVSVPHLETVVMQIEWLQRRYNLLEITRIDSPSK